MVIYIKENEIITENNYSTELKAELVEQGFQAVTVPTVDIPSDYKYSDFEKVSGKWRLKP